MPTALRIPGQGRPDSAGVRIRMCSMREFVQEDPRHIDKSMKLHAEKVAAELEDLPGRLG